jgi:hypothetical protein
MEILHMVIRLVERTLDRDGIAVAEIDALEVSFDIIPARDDDGEAIGFDVWLTEFHSVVVNGIERVQPTDWLDEFAA